ncbi:MAG: NMD3-related protein [Candidatus Woesearchaeota archaeon]
MAFCPVCGKNIRRGESFCEDHKPSRLEVKPFDVRLCSCGRLFAHNHWFHPQDLESSILKVVKDHVKQKVPIRLESLDVPEKRGNKGYGKAVATVQGEEVPLDFPVKLQRCEKCALAGTEYFTAKLQLREPPEEALPFVQEQLAGVEDKGVAVNKVADTPRGPDLYLTHKSAARQVGEKLVRRFGGRMKASEQLFSQDRQTSKGLYRLNVVVDFPHFSTGDVVSLKGRPVLVTGLGKQCTGRDLFADKKAVFTAGDEDEVLKRHKTTVAVTHPEAEVIHPVTFQQVPVATHENLLEGLQDGQKVRVVILKKRVYVIPRL